MKKTKAKNKKQDPKLVKTKKYKTKKGQSKNKSAKNKSENSKISQGTKKLLKAKKIKAWQASLRERVHINQILEKYPKTGSPSPEGAPNWAGGRGLAKCSKEKKSWSPQEIKEIYNIGFKKKLLLPWEASLLFNQTSKKVISLLKECGANLQGLDPSPNWIPKWAQYGKNGETKSVENVEGSRPQPQSELPLILVNAEDPTKEGFFKKHLSHNIKKGKWSEKDKINLKHYWKSELLGSDEIAALMERCPLKTIEMAKTLGLPNKHRVSTQEWCGIEWNFTPEGFGDPRHLEASLQRLVAEASATRFSLLYEVIQTLKEGDKDYRKIQRELDRILELHTRIFSKYLITRSKKYKFLGTSAWQVQKDLEQAGHTAIFECLRRWHPNRNIRFSRGTVTIAINREMLAWLEQQRLVELPDKIRSVARKLKQAQDRGDWENEVKRLKKEAGENCVREASKHQNTYAYLHTVPLMENYDEHEAEFGGVTGGTANCIEEFTAVCHPENDTDVSGLLLEACNAIPEAEKRAVLAYHGINEDGSHGVQQTLEEIGEKEGVTKERIRQRILKGKQRMRRWLERKNIRNINDALTQI